MEFIKQIERLQLLNKLVREKRTGSPEELAGRIGVSRAKLYLILEELKDEGICIRFSKKLNSFTYENCEGLQLGFSFKVLEATEEISINAGKFFTFFPVSNILDGSKLS
ncbi:Lrp/AsnC family transcriptional regulator [Algoriphagus sp. SE2]|uniref:Lrp/AsnC family transcriptional regulator n=1 Tax=Algoriphagus sp. SE2 TaxID=3141536 RepID=UPI0031CCF302